MWYHTVTCLPNFYVTLLMACLVCDIKSCLETHVTVHVAIG